MNLSQTLSNRPSLFKVNDHTTSNSTFMIGGFELNGSNILLRYIIGDSFPSFSDVKHLTVDIFKTDGKPLTTLDFRVMFVSYENIKLDWYDPSKTLEATVKFKVLDT